MSNFGLERFFFYRFSTKITAEFEKFLQLKALNFDSPPYLLLKNISLYINKFSENFEANSEF